MFDTMYVTSSVKCEGRCPADGSTRMITKLDAKCRRRRVVNSRAH